MVYHLDIKEQDLFLPNIRSEKADFFFLIFKIKIDEHNLSRYLTDWRHWGQY